MAEPTFVYDNHHKNESGRLNKPVSEGHITQVASLITNIRGVITDHYVGTEMPTFRSGTSKASEGKFLRQLSRKEMERKLINQTK